MNYFTDDEFWDLRGRGAAINMFVDSCFHLLRSSESLKVAEAKRLGSDIRVAFVGIAGVLASLARTEHAGEFSFEFVEYDPEGFGVKIQVAEDRFPEAFLAVFAEEVTLAGRELRFRVRKLRLESMVCTRSTSTVARSDRRRGTQGRWRRERRGLFEFVSGSAAA